MRHFTIRRVAPGTGIAVAGALVLAGCGSASPPGTASAASNGRSAGTASPAIVIKTGSSPGLGTVLVDGGGRTLYMLTSEQGGKITCTDENGCTKAWPDTELPKGVTSATAGPGIRAGLLGTVKDAAGSLYVTYGGWPLYTFAGDSSPGQAKGEGITSFGGTWYVLDASGHPVTAGPSGSTTSSAPAGYGY